MARTRRRSDDIDARRAQWLAGTLDICVLSLIGSGARYGYELSVALEAAGLGKVKGATLYPRLRAMEDEGLLESEWVPGDGGPERKYYRASAAGRALLTRLIAAYDDFATTVAEVTSHAK